MSFKNHTEILVRFAECDYYQHVNNAVYLTYMDVGLGSFLREVYKDVNSLDILFHYVHMSVDLRAPATFNDILDVETHISNIGSTSLTFSFRITNRKTNVLIAEGKKVCVILSAKTNQKTVVPEALKKCYSA